MKKQHLIKKRVQSIAGVSKKVISILRKMQYMEQKDGTNSELFSKCVLKLQELLLHEKNLCEKLSKDEATHEVILKIIENPQRFQSEYSLKGWTFSRVFRNLFIFNQEQYLHLLNTIPAFASIEASDKYSPVLINAFNEDLFTKYMSLLDDKIANYDALRNDLIDEKYKLFTLYANKGDFFINKYVDKKEPPSQTLMVMQNENINEKFGQFLIAEFAYQFCDNYYNQMLMIDNEQYNQEDNQVAMLMHFNCLDTILSVTNDTIKQNLENLFYKKFYYLQKDYNVDNSEVAAAILTRIQTFQPKIKKKS